MTNHSMQPCVLTCLSKMFFSYNYLPKSKKKYKIFDNCDHSGFFKSAFCLHPTAASFKYTHSCFTCTSLFWVYEFETFNEQSRVVCEKSAISVVLGERVSFLVLSWSSLAHDWHRLTWSWRITIFRGLCDEICLFGAFWQEWFWVMRQKHLAERWSFRKTLMKKDKLNVLQKQQTNR